jgi:hypothetical protein
MIVSRSRLGFLLASAVAILTAGVVVAPQVAAAPATVSPLVLASGPSPFAGCPFGATGAQGEAVYVNAETEPWVAVNPRNPANLIGVFQQDRWNTGGSHGLVTATSFNGGATWTRTFPHFSQCAGGTAANGGDYPRSSDPWVSIGPDGTAYQVSLSFAGDNSLSAILASVSRDGGLTWSEPATIKRDATPIPGINFNDKESVTADPHRAGTAYVVWDRSAFPSDSASLNGLIHSFAFRGTPWFSKTTDGGRSWSPAAPMSSQNIGSIGNQVAVEPDGTLIDVFHYGKGSGFDQPNASLIGVMTSTDGGAHWSPPSQISNNPVVLNRDPETGVPLRTGADVGGAIPDIAVDPVSGALYVVWEDSRFSGTHDDIALSKSIDGGKTWTDPVKVNQTPVPVIAFTPAVDVLPNGTVAVTYYDIRNNTPAPGLLTDYFVVHSHNGGATWSESRITPTSFDEETAPVALGRGYFIGDYQGLANTGSTFKSFFVQTNSGNLANRTDAFATTVAP